MTPQPDLSKWLSKFDAARLLGIGESTLDRRIKRTGCPEVRMRPRGNGLKPEPMCNPDDVARMMEESKRAVVMPPETAVQVRQLFFDMVKVLDAIRSAAPATPASLPENPPENPALWRVRCSWRLARRFARYELPVIRSWVRAWWHCMKGHEIIDWGEGWNCDTCEMDLENGTKKVCRPWLAKQRS